MEDSIILVGEEFQDVKLIQEYPILQKILMQMTEEEWLKSQKKFSSFKLYSPEQRYLNFLDQRKDLHNRVSNYQIASYLGMTPESLSRIRKRLLHKDKNG